jgi:magnesium-transporting ATPase (P-type)
MENKLKPETFQAISNLKNANIRTIMCTGDNMLTALSVSRECQIIDSHNENICLVEVGDNKKLNFTNIPKSNDLDVKVRNFLLINCQIFIYICNS